jgi:hypothetical protein
MAERRDGSQAAAAPFSDRLISLPSVAILGVGIGLIVLSWGGRMLYDPNADSVERAGAPRTAPEGPYRRAEYEALVREAAAQEEAKRAALANSTNVAGRRIQCPHCEQTFATTAQDRCPLCHADWTASPPTEVA